MGPKWETLHQAASKYLIIFLLVLAVLLAGYLLFRFYKIQIKNFFIQWLTRLTNRFRTIRATEIFLTCLTSVLIGFVILMFGLAQDYLANDVAQFNQIAEYVVYTAVYTDWMKGFLIFQQPAAIAGLIVLTIIRIWLKNQNSCWSIYYSRFPFSAESLFAHLLWRPSLSFKRLVLKGHFILTIFRI